MAKKSRAQMRLGSLICLVLAALIIGGLFLPFVTITTTTDSILTDEKKDFVNYEGYEFIAGLFKSKDDIKLDDENVDINTIVLAKDGDKTKAGSYMIMIGAIVAGIASALVLVIALLNLLIPNSLFSLLLKLLTVLAFLGALVAMIGGFILAGNMASGGLDLGIIGSVKVAGSIGWAAIVVAVLGLANAGVAFLVKK